MPTSTADEAFSKLLGNFRATLDWVLRMPDSAFDALDPASRGFPCDARHEDPTGGSAIPVALPGCPGCQGVAFAIAVRRPLLAALHADAVLMQSPLRWEALRRRTDDACEITRYATDSLKDALEQAPETHDRIDQFLMMRWVYGLHRWWQRRYAPDESDAMPDLPLPAHVADRAACEARIEALGNLTEEELRHIRTETVAGKRDPEAAVATFRENCLRRQKLLFRLASLHQAGLLAPFEHPEEACPD